MPPSGKITGSKNPTRSYPIDDSLKLCSNAMVSGHVVHVHVFDLFRAMSALVILDPKQDSGTALRSTIPRERKPTMVRAPLHLNDSEAAYVFDSLLACEATWHRGQALASTVYTCQYMHDRIRLHPKLSPVLGAYFNAVHISLATIRSVVSEAGVGDEEDFYSSSSTGQFGLRMPEADTETEKGTIERLKAAEKGIQGGGDSSHLLSRIRFRLCLQAAMGYLSNEPSARHADHARHNLDKAAHHLEEIRTSVDSYSHITSCIQNASHWDHLDWEPDGLGFNSKIYASYTGPPQTACLLSRKCSIAHFSRLVVDMRRVCDIVSLCGKRDGAKELLHLLSWISNSDSGIIPRAFAALFVYRDDILLRTRIWKAALPSMWICNTIHEHCLPWPHPCHRHHGSEELFKNQSKICQQNCTSSAINDGNDDETFMGDAHNGLERTNDNFSGNSLHEFRLAGARDVKLLIRTHFSSRCRHHRRLRHLHKEWTYHDSIAGGAETYQRNKSHRLLARTACPQTLAFSNRSVCPCISRTQSILIHVQISQLIMGFDLHLYLPHELVMIYWYKDYLLTVQAGILAAEQSTDQTWVTEDATRERQRATHFSGNVISDICAEHDVGRIATARAEAESGFTTLKSMMCQGLLRMLVALDASGRVHKPVPNEFTDDEQHFWLRFGQFHSSSKPVPMRWFRFSKCIVHYADQPIAKLFESALGSFSQARHKVKELMERHHAITPAQSADLQVLDRIVAANMMAIRLMNVSGITVVFDYKQHDVFVTMLVNKKSKCKIASS